ncbi:hypothetical protein SGRI78S_06902 [Streptomyces griseus subsp. griseus]
MARTVPGIPGAVTAERQSRAPTVERMTGREVAVRIMAAGSPLMERRTSWATAATGGSAVGRIGPPAIRSTALSAGARPKCASAVVLYWASRQTV